MTLSPKGLPVLRLVDARAHDELLNQVRLVSEHRPYLLKLLSDFEKAEADLKQRLVGKQLRLYPE